MSCRYVKRFVWAALLMFGFTAGCSDDPTTPEDSTPPTLNSGNSYAAWVLDGVPGSAGQFALEMIGVSSRHGEAPEIRVRVGGTAGTLSQVVEMSEADFQSYLNLSYAVIAEHEHHREGCDSTDSLVEYIDVFTGDHGQMAYISGCDDQASEAVRAFSLELVAKYFPGD